MIIPIVFAVNSRGVSHRAPADFIIISLLDESEETIPLIVQGRNKNGENISKVIFSVGTRKGYPELHRITIEDKITSDTSFNNYPAPLPQIENKDIPPASSLIKGESKGDLSPDQDNTYSSRKNSLTLSGMSSTIAEENLSQRIANLKNINRLPANTGNADISKTIRTAIEKALIYPPLAKKRGIEGTVTAGFSINSRGYPENIKILRTSGHEILDSAAIDTVTRASPLPFIKGNIEIPITFILKKEN